MIEKAIVVIEHTIGERIYRLELPLGAPFSDCIDATADLHKYVIEMSRRKQPQPDDQPSEHQEPFKAETTD